MKTSFFQVILLSVFGIAALIGLFVFATYSSTNSNKAQIGTVVIWGTIPKLQMEQALQVATAANQDLKGVSYVEKSEDTFANDLATAIATNSGPDLILLNQEDLLTLAKFIEQIPSASLPASSFTSAFAEEGELFLAPGGASAYGIPFLLDPLVLFENRTLLSSNGIAETPATWEALTGLVPHVAILTPSQNVSRALIALGTYTNVHDARAILSALFLQAGASLSAINQSGVRSADLGTTLSTEGTPAGEAVVRFYTQFADPSKVSYTWNASLPDSEQFFETGDSALYLGFASEGQYLSAANPNLDFITAPLPQPATATTKSTYGLLYAFSIPLGAKNSAGALLAAAALTDPKADGAASAATGMAPADLSLLATPPANPFASVAYASALYAKGWLSPAPASTDQVFGAMISNVTSGRLMANSALSEAESELSALLTQ